MSYSQGGHIRWLGTPIPELPVPFNVHPVHAETWRKTQLSFDETTPVMYVGTAGTGKTTFMAWIARKLRVLNDSGISYRTRATWLDDEVWWTTASGYVDDVHAGRNYARKYSQDWGDDYDATGLARRAKYLFVDDLGTEPSDVAGNLDIMTRLIEDRQRDQKKTWFTTNLSSKMLNDRYGQRFISRLLSMAVPVVMSPKAHELPRYGDQRPTQAFKNPAKQFPNA